MTDSMVNTEVTRTACISFLLVSELRDFRFDPARFESLEFTSEDPPVAINLKSMLPPEAMGGGSHKIECRLMRTLDVDPDLADFVAGLAEYRYVRLEDSPITTPFYLKGEMRVAEDGKLCKREQVPFEAYPKRIRELADKMSAVLRTDQQRFLRLLRWSQEGESSQLLYDWEPQLYWSASGRDYSPVAREDVGSPGRSLFWGIGWEPHHQELLAKLWSDESVNEPVAHELLREAHSLAAQGSLRSALLMSASAVEVGTKDHISRRRPHTEWLMQNMPSPPVHKILRKYLQEMHSELPAKDLWEKISGLWTRAQKLAEARNDIAHAGSKVEPSAVWEHLRTAHDVLYVLDVLDGHEWAKTRVSFELRKILGWPDPPEMRIAVTWSPTRWLPD